jgi:hypothetical protein
LFFHHLKLCQLLEVKSGFQHGGQVDCDMTNDFESTTSSDQNSSVAQPFSRLRMGAFATVSLMAAGMSAAWWYRKTLTKLRQAEGIGPHPQIGIPEEDPGGEA